jgi:hypothetical protein
VGLLIAIEAEPPFASASELASLVDELGGQVRVELETDHFDVIARLLAAADDDAGLAFECPLTRAAVDVLVDYAGQRAAFYVDAHHLGGNLRVWRDDIWIDGLHEHPGWGDVRTRENPFGPGEVFDLRSREHERTLTAWRALSSGERLTVRCAGVQRDALERLWTTGPSSMRVTTVVDSRTALAVAQILPSQPMTWSTGNLHAELPELTARIHRLAPVSEEDEASVRALFDRHRTAI